MTLCRSVPASIAASLSADEASVSEDALTDLASRVMSTVLVLDEVAQREPRIVEQAAVLHGQGVRIRSLTLFYEEWLGKLPISELERASLLFRSEEHTSELQSLMRISYAVFC